jgi:hypothetical protein
MELRSAVSMTVEPTCASTDRASPDASVNVIFGIEQNDSLEYRVTPQGRVDFAGNRRLYRARLHRASAEAPKGHSEHRMRLARFAQKGQRGAGAASDLSAR